MFWREAEYIIYGKTTQKILDDVIAVILTISIFYNLV